MSEEEKKQRYRDFKETITLIVSVLTLLGIPAAIWAVNARFTIQSQTMMKAMADGYVPKDWFTKSHEQTTTQIESLRSDVGDVKTDIAVIKSKLDQNVVRTGH